MDTAVARPAGRACPAAHPNSRDGTGRTHPMPRHLVRPAGSTIEPSRRGLVTGVHGPDRRQVILPLALAPPARPQALGQVGLRGPHAVVFYPVRGIEYPRRA